MVWVWLPDGEKISKISLFFLAQLTNVTDGQTPHADIYRAYAYASRGKNSQHAESWKCRRNVHREPWHKQRRRRHWLMTATTIERSSFLHSTTVIRLTVSVAVLLVVIKTTSHMLRWKCNCSNVLSTLRKKFSKFHKISSILNKIMLQILWLCFLHTRCNRSLCLGNDNRSILSIRLVCTRHIEW